MPLADDKEFFDKNSEKSDDFSFLEEYGNWEALVVRMSRRTMILRRRRVFLWSMAAAACLVMFLFLIMPVLNRIHLRLKPALVGLFLNLLIFR